VEIDILILHATFNHQPLFNCFSIQEAVEVAVGRSHYVTELSGSKRRKGQNCYFHITAAILKYNL